MQNTRFDLYECDPSSCYPWWLSFNCFYFYFLRSAMSFSSGESDEEPIMAGRRAHAPGPATRVELEKVKCSSVASPV